MASSAVFAKDGVNNPVIIVKGHVLDNHALVILPRDYSHYLEEVTMMLFKEAEPLDYYEPKRVYRWKFDPATVLSRLGHFGFNNVAACAIDRDRVLNWTLTRFPE